MLGKKVGVAFFQGVFDVLFGELAEETVVVGIHYAKRVLRVLEEIHQVGLGTELQVHFFHIGQSLIRKVKLGGGKEKS